MTPPRLFLVGGFAFTDGIRILLGKDCHPGPDFFGVFFDYSLQEANEFFCALSVLLGNDLRAELADQ